MDNFTVKMMPGQTPYTDAELKRLYKMADAACRAEELFDIDELEAYAERRRKHEAT
jgi:hypothetical protein